MRAKRGPGRPRVAKDKAHVKAFTTCLTPDELQKVKTAAKRAGKSASAWARDGLLRVADDEAAARGRVEHAES